MRLTDMLLENINIPSKTSLGRMSDKDLFELANLNRKFKQVMIKFILSEDFKPDIPMENKFYIRKMGLPERIKNSLLQNEFEYLDELSFVSPKELLQMKGMGKKGLSDLIKILDNLDIQLTN
jgi:DNA-directed RNA polymerase alpha subunit